MEAEGNLLRFLYITGAAVAGAISALPTMRWKEMGIGERLLTVFVGSAFAVFLTPLIATRLVKVSYGDLQTICALTYIMGVCGNAIVPVLIDRARKFAREWGEKRAVGQEDTL